MRQPSGLPGATCSSNRGRPGGTTRRRTWPRRILRPRPSGSLVLCLEEAHVRGDTVARFEENDVAGHDQCVAPHLCLSGQNALDTLDGALSPVLLKEADDYGDDASKSWQRPGVAPGCVDAKLVTAQRSDVEVLPGATICSSPRLLMK